MSFPFSPAEAAELERRALANGGRVVRRADAEKPVCLEPRETMMAWSEERFDAEFQKLFRSCGWLGYHTWMSIRSKPGFPDWVLVRERVVFVELKKQKGKESDVQKAWRRALIDAKAEAYLFRPAQWEEIVEVLK